MSRKGDCSPFNELVFNYIADHPEINNVILTARWPISAEGTRYKTEGGKSVVLVDLDDTSNENKSNEELFEIGLMRTVTELLDLGRNVTIVSSVPEVGYVVPPANFVAVRSGRDVNRIISPTLQEYTERNTVVFAAMAAIQERYPEVTIIEPSEGLCDQDRCRVVENDQPLYQDDDHLSTIGGLYIAHVFDSCFETMNALD